ncbi:MAG: alpha/beta hydrolase [Rhizobiaceae bacterium]
MRPLVLVHGFMGGSAQWDLQRETLGKGRELIAVDHPGFGTNNHQQAPDTIGGYARSVLDHVTSLGVDQFDLLGHSMGGMIVQEMTALAPERVSRLVLYGTACTGNLPGRFETFEQSRQRVKADGVSPTARRISATWFADYERAEQFENCAAIAEQSTLQAMLAALDAMESWSRADNLADIDCPTLVVWGELDRTYRWPQVDMLWREISDCSLAVLPGCAHAAHLEKPGLFNSIVDDYLN